MSEDFGVEAWESETTAFDRVQSIAMCLDDPMGAGEIAEAAHVAENTARSHLDRLSKLGLLQSTSQEGATVYYPDPLYTRMRTLRTLLDEYDRDGLIDLRASLQERIEGWEEEYDTGSPETLRGLASQADSAEETREFQKTASDWELVQYRLSVVSEAVEYYDVYTVSPLDGRDDDCTKSLPSGVWTGLSDEGFYNLIREEL